MSSSTAVSSGLTLSTDYFMRNFYANNRNAISTSGRSDYSDIELSYEDSRALSRAAKRLMSSDYGSDSEDEDDIDETLKSTIEAFVETYNNAIETGDTSDHDTSRYLSRLKSLTKEYSSELSEIGISIEKDGTLTLNDDLLTMADNSKVKEIFSSDNDYTKNAMSIAEKLNNAVRNNIFSQVTGSGLKINITL